MKNWSGSVRFNPEAVRQPQNEDEILSLLHLCDKEDKGIRMVGSAHSFTPLIQTGQILLNLDRYQGLCQADPEQQLARVKSGTKLKALGSILHEQGFSQENLGDIDVQAIAGALTTGTHGTGVNFGTLATQIQKIRLLTAQARVIECSEEENPAIFKAAQISLGALGVISELTLKAVPAYKLKYCGSKAPLEQVLEKLEDYKTRNRHFEFYYFPYARQVQVKESNITEEANKGGGFSSYFNDVILENVAFWLLSRISRHIPGTSRGVSRLSAKAISARTKIDWSHKVFATKRMVRFHEMEYNLPAEAFKDCFQEVVQTIEKKKYRLHFPIECRFVKGDDIWLSPAYQRDSAYIAVHQYRGMDYSDYFRDMEAIFRKYNGRPHWGKMHTLTSEDCRNLYPKWQDFLEIRESLDPKGMFLNDYLIKLFGLKKLKMAKA